MSAKVRVRNPRGMGAFVGSSILPRSRRLGIESEWAMQKAMASTSSEIGKVKPKQLSLNWKFFRIALSSSFIPLILQFWSLFQLSTLSFLFYFDSLLNSSPWRRKSRLWSFNLADILWFFIYCWSNQCRLSFIS